MTECCPPPENGATRDPLYRRVLWIVLFINAAMFLVEGASGIYARSVALEADALDFLGDAANYGIALYVLGRSMTWRAGTAMLKGVVMACFGTYVMGNAVYRVLVLGLPDAGIMGGVGTLALVANVTSAFLLYRYRAGDSNMRAVWVCSRNDAISNVVVIIAAGAVAYTNTGWPDLGVAAIMAGLALWGATQIIRHALEDLRTARGEDGLNVI